MNYLDRNNRLANVNHCHWSNTSMKMNWNLSMDPIDGCLDLQVIGIHLFVNHLHRWESKERKKKISSLSSIIFSWMHNIKTLMIRQKDLRELYDQQANCSMLDDVNRVRLLLVDDDDEHQESNDDAEQQQPMQHRLLHMDHMQTY